MITQKFSGGIMLTFAQIKLELPESSDSARQVTRQVAGQVMVFNSPHSHDNKILDG